MRGIGHRLNFAHLSILGLLSCGSDAPLVQGYWAGHEQNAGPLRHLDLHFVAVSVSPSELSLGQEDRGDRVAFAGVGEQNVSQFGLLDILTNVDRIQQERVIVDKAL